MKPVQKLVRLRRSRSSMRTNPFHPSWSHHSSTQASTPFPPSFPSHDVLDPPCLFAAEYSAVSLVPVSLSKGLSGRDVLENLESIRGLAVSSR
jgi:hypothetical protein